MLLLADQGSWELGVAPLTRGVSGTLAIRAIAKPGVPYLEVPVQVPLFLRLHLHLPALRDRLGLFSPF